MSGGHHAPATTLRGASPEEAGMSTSRLRRITELGQELVRGGLATNVVLLIARRGRIVFHEAFGRLTPDEDSKPTPLDALFPLASVGKVFTATALMVLVEEGRVGLNRPVSNYLPDFQGEGKDRVLVRHLLTHTAGIKDEEVEKWATDHKGKVDIPPADGTIHPLHNEYFALRYGCPLWKAPGEEMSYSPYSFELIGEIIRRVSRTSLDRFARARVFQPLGMNDTFPCPVDAPPERRVRRAPDPSVVPDPLDEAHEKERLAWGSGGEISSAKDLAIFGQMFLNGGAYGTERVLSPASVAAMTRNQIPGVGAKFLDLTFPEAAWGLGWSLHGSKTGMCGGLYSPESFEHWGAGGLYFWVDPVYQLIGVYLSTDPVYLHPEVRNAPWRNDLFTDMATAAIVEL
jgi:serine-type D-Ala-D-Ala carboxypeptidase